MEIKIEYILDNNDWSDEQFEDAGDTRNEFTITDEMIKLLIRENVKLKQGDFIAEIYKV